MYISVDSVGAKVGSGAAVWLGPVDARNCSIIYPVRPLTFTYAHSLYWASIVTGVPLAKSPKEADFLLGLCRRCSFPAFPVRIYRAVPTEEDEETVFSPQADAGSPAVASAAQSSSAAIPLTIFRSIQDPPSSWRFLRPENGRAIHLVSL